MSCQRCQLHRCCCCTQNLHPPTQPHVMGSAQDAVAQHRPEQLHAVLTLLIAHVTYETEAFQLIVRLLQPMQAQRWYRSMDEAVPSRAGSPDSECRQRAASATRRYGCRE